MKNCHALRGVYLERSRIRRHVELQHGSTRYALSRVRTPRKLREAPGGFIFREGCIQDLHALTCTQHVNLCILFVKSAATLHFVCPSKSDAIPFASPSPARWYFTRIRIQPRVSTSVTKSGRFRFNSTDDTASILRWDIHRQILRRAKIYVFITRRGSSKMPNTFATIVYLRNRSCRPSCILLCNNVKQACLEHRLMVYKHGFINR